MPVATGDAESLELVDDELEEGGEEVRSAVEWAQVRALAVDGFSQREIARRLGINRRTVRRLVETVEPPRYQRAAVGSMLDPLEPAIRRLIDEWPQIKAPRVTELLRADYAYSGSIDLVRKRMALLRPCAVRPAQRTGYRPAQVMQVDWAEMPTRPKIAGRERRVYALICSLSCSGASTAHFSFDMTAEPVEERAAEPRTRRVHCSLHGAHVRRHSGSKRDCHEAGARGDRAARGLATMDELAESRRVVAGPRHQSLTTTSASSRTRARRLSNGNSGAPCR